MVMLLLKNKITTAIDKYSLSTNSVFSTFYTEGYGGKHNRQDMFSTFTELMLEQVKMSKKANKTSKSDK